MPFEEPPRQAGDRPDRKLGDEWLDWNGTIQSNDTRQPIGVFLGLSALVAGVLAFLGWGAVWLVTPRLQILGWEQLPRILGLVWTAYLLLWLMMVCLGTGGWRFAGSVMRWLGGIRWILTLTVAAGKIFGRSRDQVGHSFILTYNRLEKLPAAIHQPGRLLLLLPRCLARDHMLQLRALREKYGFTQVVALGGTEARKAIMEARPEGIVAVACERDLLVGIKDLRGRIPVLAFSNLRPQGPCKDTRVDMQAIEDAIRMFLGKT
ncbi:DUF116 domain-containing protein [candidate division FCPU426 bacterium]|nr:DUF116 domain-containing protein [candidate division FCPU426 bacterium]